MGNPEQFSSLLLAWRYSRGFSDRAAAKITAAEQRQDNFAERVESFSDYRQGVIETLIKRGVPKDEVEAFFDASAQRYPHSIILGAHACYIASKCEGQPITIDPNAHIKEAAGFMLATQNIDRDQV